MHFSPRTRLAPPALAPLHSVSPLGFCRFVPVHFHTLRLFPSSPLTPCRGPLCGMVALFAPTTVPSCTAFLVSGFLAPSALPCYSCWPSSPAARPLLFSCPLCAPSAALVGPLPPSPLFALLCTGPCSPLPLLSYASAPFPSPALPSPAPPSPLVRFSLAPFGPRPPLIFPCSSFPAPLFSPGSFALVFSCRPWPYQRPAPPFLGLLLFVFWFLRSAGLGLLLSPFFGSTCLAGFPLLRCFGRAVAVRPVPMRPSVFNCFGGAPGMF